MPLATEAEHSFLATPWREKLVNFGFTVIATVIGGLLVAGILWGVGALSQVSSLTTKVDLLEDNMNRGFDDLKSSVASLADDTTLENVKNNVNKLRYELNDFVTNKMTWQHDVELRLTVLENPVGGSVEDDRIGSSDPDSYLPKLQRGSRR